MTECQGSPEPGEVDTGQCNYLCGVLRSWGGGDSTGVRQLDSDALPCISSVTWQINLFKPQFYSYNVTKQKHVPHSYCFLVLTR